MVCLEIHSGEWVEIRRCLFWQRAKITLELFAQWAALCDPFQVGRVRSWRSCVSALSAVSELDQELLYVCHPSYTTPP